MAAEKSVVHDRAISPILGAATELLDEHALFATTSIPSRRKTGRCATSGSAKLPDGGDHSGWAVGKFLRLFATASASIAALRGRTSGMCG